MKIITATMAKNIANDFMNNKCGPVIKEAMNKILYGAEMGRHEITLLIPAGWDEETIRSVGIFFGGLGYSVETYSNIYHIKW